MWAIACPKHAAIFCLLQLYLGLHSSAASPSIKCLYRLYAFFVDFPMSRYSYTSVHRLLIFLLLLLARDIRTNCTSDSQARLLEGTTSRNTSRTLLKEYSILGIRRAFRGLWCRLFDDRFRRLFYFSSIREDISGLHERSALLNDAMSKFSVGYLWMDKQKPSPCIITDTTAPSMPLSQFISCRNPKSRIVTEHGYNTGILTTWSFALPLPLPSALIANLNAAV